jgi:hypothetical protein
MKKEAMHSAGEMRGMADSAEKMKVFDAARIIKHNRRIDSTNYLLYCTDENR